MQIKDWRSITVNIRFATVTLSHDEHTLRCKRKYWRFSVWFFSFQRLRKAFEGGIHCRALFFSSFLSFFLFFSEQSCAESRSEKLGTGVRQGMREEIMPGILASGRLETPCNHAVTTCYLRERRSRPLCSVSRRILIVRRPQFRKPQQREKRETTNR